MAEDEIITMSAGALARAIRAKRLSPVDAVRASLARIEAVDPVLNCFCFVYAEEALAEARAAEERVMRGDALGPLHGVPIAIKDLTPTNGKRTTLGSHLYKDWVPDANATVVDRLLAAGAIMVGKTTTSELAYAFVTETPLWGITRNPWNPDHTPGGSSGGSAAAVASRCVPLAEGSDAGGSIRLPASFCGIVGLKPSFGRVPTTLFPSEFDTFTHHGPLCRTIEDAAIFLNATQGPSDSDALSLPGLPEVSLAADSAVAGSRFALSLDLGYNRVDPEILQNTQRAAETLRAMDAVVEEIDLPWTPEIATAGWLHWDVYTALIVGDRLEKFRDRMDPSVVAAVERGRRVSALEFKNVELVRTRHWQALRPILQRFDALLCPTTSVPAMPIGTPESSYGHVDDDGKFHHFEMTFPFNMLSPLPALTVPSGLTESGLPTGLQIVGRRHADQTVLRIGQALEAGMPWIDRAPPEADQPREIGESRP